MLFRVVLKRSYEVSSFDFYSSKEAVEFAVTAHYNQAIKKDERPLEVSISLYDDSYKENEE